MELAIANYLKEATQPTENQQLQKLHRDVSIAFKYSLVRPGSPFAPADGLATKKVPLYRASEIFGHAIAATVVPWLLHLPLSSTDENTSQSPRYVGIVALPCTTQLAAQFHRHAAYIKEI
ncbi:hypothetical protein IW140_004494 [Coemansia sp. RSA 1813]|nr:hypothetical protein IW140_004494 [Coemansia sp. RSA 1813]